MLTSKTLWSCRDGGLDFAQVINVVSQHWWLRRLRIFFGKSFGFSLVCLSPRRGFFTHKHQGELSGGGVRMKAKKQGGQREPLRGRYRGGDSIIWKSLSERVALERDRQALCHRLVMYQIALNKGCKADKCSQKGEESVCAATKPSKSALNSIKSALDSSRLLLPWLS